MEINVKVRKDADSGKLYVDIHIEDMDAMKLPLFHADEIRDMARPQVEFILRGIKDPGRRKELARAIVDGTLMSRSSYAVNESGDWVSSDSDTHHHTEEDS